MGVFDSIRDKLGVSDEEQSDDSAAGDDGGAASQEQAAQTRPSEEGAGEGADESPDPADDLQTHGNHWAALLPPEDREDDVQDLLDTTLEDGEELEGEPRDGDEVTAYRHQDGPIGMVAVALDDEVLTGYPIVDGVEHEVDVEQVGEWKSEIEAWLIGECGPATLTAFASNYYELDKDSVGGPKDADIAVVMYNVAEAETETIEGEDGEEIDVSDFAGFRPWEQGAPDDCVVRTEIDDVETVEFAGHELYRIEAPLLRQEDVDPLEGVFYVADHVAGDYEPEAGDTIEGAAWIQGAFREQ